MRSVITLLFVLSGCVRSAEAVKRDLSVDEVTPLFAPKVQDAEGWSRDLILALKTNELPVDLPHVCSVIAVAEQESGVQANPVVPGLPAIARKALSEKANGLGPLGPMVLSKLLEGKAPGSSKTFEQRLDGLRTEADLDLLFRDILADHQQRSPMLYAAANVGATLLRAGSFEDRNPVTTAGSMQVSVRFAEEHASKLRRDSKTVRDALYTRAGGLLYGSARLWSYEASYDSMLYRFADYNAGAYTSRNAAFQEQVASLAHMTLALDGDLLAYDASGAVKSADTKSMAALHRATEGKNVNVERDARKEKSQDFEKTATWVAVRGDFAKRHNGVAAYARLPDVQLHSPKIQKPLTTAWFAQAVGRRYEACLKRALRYQTSR